MSGKGKNVNLILVRKKILKMILPITIERVLQMAAGIVSMAMIGRIDTNAVSAMGIGDRIVQIVFALFNGISIGATVFVSQSYGAKNYKKLGSVVQQTLLASFLIVILLQQIIFWNTSAILSVFNPDPELMESAVSYLRAVSFGLPFQAIMLIVSGSLQGTGNTKTPMFITITMNCINLVLGYTLVFGEFGFPQLGVVGAGISLSIAQFIAALIGLYVLFRKNGILYKLRNKNFFKFNLRLIADIFAVGLPSSMESLLFQFAAIILTRAMLSFGKVAFSAYQMGMRAESMSYMPAFGFSVVTTSLVGQCIGSKEPDYGKAYLKETTKGSILITSIAAFFLIFFPKQVMGLLTNNQGVIDLGAYYLKIIGIVQIPQNLAGVLGGALRGAGFTKVPMFTALAGLWGVRVPFTLLFTYVFKLDIIFIWGAMGMDLVFRFFLSFFLYKRRNIFNTSAVFEKATYL